MEIEKGEVLDLQMFKSFGTTVEIMKEFGGRKQYFEAIREIENALFQVDVA